ncbi:armadillo-type protein [Bisporella sp. PMI_857]|nr:armadillo-type protein [Bisporella sp. PMI_857]
MPRENKNRGRREEKKLKRKAEAIENAHSKREKASELLEDLDVEQPRKSKKQKITGLEDAFMEDPGEVANDRPFYGMLEDEEQEYFRRADELLALNDFPSDEERGLFLANVFKEAENKELKIACSQSCSRLMERLILLSTTTQKKKLFEKFKGNFAHLVQHRFASHCCEALFIQSAGVVIQELTEVVKKVEEEDGAETLPSMEDLFLLTLDELDGSMTALLTDRFASHTLRVLLIILSGRPLEKSSTKSVLQSKRKEKIQISNLDAEFSLPKRAVPESFVFAIDKIISDIVASMDESFIKILATHESGNPTLQLLLELDLASKTKKAEGQKSIISVLLPDDITNENSQSAILINGLMYDPVGSRLLEAIVTFVPGKTFKQIYRTIFKDRIASLARNEIASYVAIKVLTRLSKEDLEECVTAMLPHISGLIERKRTIPIKTLIERCHARSIDTNPLTEAIGTAYGSDPSTLLLNMACIIDLPALTTTVLPRTTTDDNQAPPNPTTSPEQLHGSLLAQSLLHIPGPPSVLMHNAILALPSSTLHTLALYTPTAHILQAALHPLLTPLPSRRKLISAILCPSESVPSPVITLSSSNVGTHILDSLLLNAPSLFLFAERISASLLGHEEQLRNSWTGRIVWRNWSCDLLKRRRSEWVSWAKSLQPTPPPPLSIAATQPGNAPIGMLSKEEVEIAKGGRKEFSTAPITPAEARKAKKEKKKLKSAQQVQQEKRAEVTTPATNGKTALQLARERFAEEKKRKERMKASKGTGANGIMA